MITQGLKKKRKEKRKRKRGFSVAIQLLLLGKISPGPGNSKHKGPEAGVFLAAFGAGALVLGTKRTHFFFFFFNLTAFLCSASLRAKKAGLTGPKFQMRTLKLREATGLIQGLGLLLPQPHAALLLFGPRKLGGIERQGQLDHRGHLVRRELWWEKK